MEFLNKIELQGYIGSIKVDTVGESKSARFSLCTQRAYTDGDAKAIECTWFNCIAFEGEQIKNLYQLQKNNAIHLKGRVNAHAYADASGASRYMWEVICQEIEVLPE